MATTDITAQHPDYAAALPEWEMIEDASAGERAVKAKGETYLPKPNCADKSAENAERYKQYVARAVYYSATGRTLQGLTGLAFKRWPEIELPASMEDFRNNVTGAGVPLIQHAQATVGGILKTGRGGILVDFPRLNREASRADQIQGGAQPTLTYYSATAITNWRTMKRGSRVVLSLVVLCETYEEVDAGGFAVELKTQYRELRLENNVYKVNVWRKVRDAEGKESWQPMADMAAEPKQGNGQPWNEIPFQFIGSQNNDTAIDFAPLRDIASVNLAHYRNSADYEDSVYMTGQPQVWVMGVNEEWLEIWKKNGIYVGSRSIGAGPQGASVQMIQAQPNQLAKEAMDQKEKQLAALGARLLVPGDAPRTATEVDSDDATAHSVLTSVCDNVSQAYEKVLAWAANFANASGEVTFSIPTEFTKVVDAATAQVLLQLVQAGKMPESDLFTALRLAGYIDSDKTDEQIRDEIGQQLPENPDDANGLNLDDPEDGTGSAPTGGTATAVRTRSAGAAGSGAAPAGQGQPQGGQGDAGGSDVAGQVATSLEAIRAEIAAALANQPAPQALGPITINLPGLPPQTFNIAPPAVTVEGTTINVAPAPVTVERQDINVDAPTVNVAPAAITVESPTVNVAPPQVNVESPTVNVAAPVVNVEQPEPAQVTVPVNVTVEKGSTSKTGTLTKQADGSYAMTVTESKKK